MKKVTESPHTCCYECVYCPENHYSNQTGKRIVIQIKADLEINRIFGLCIMSLGNLGYNFGMKLKYLFMLGFRNMKGKNTLQHIKLGLNIFRRSSFKQSDFTVD